MAGYQRSRPSSHWLDYPDTTYGTVGSAEFANWDTALERLKGLAADPRDWGVTGDGSTDDTTTLVAALAEVATAGGTFLIPPSFTITTTAAVDAPGHSRIIGFGRSSVVKGPGFKRLYTANSVQDSDLYFANFLLDGSGYTASGRGLDLLACSMVTCERVKFLGFKDQVVCDQGQRLRMVDCEHVASTGTRFGLWIPKGPEANAGVDAAIAMTNIVHLDNSHFNWFNSGTGTPIADDGGLQHTYDNVQCSYGVNSMRLAGVSGITIRSCDFEFMSGDTIKTASTAAGDGSAVGKVAALTIGPGNYFGGQVDLTGTDMLVDIGNEFHIPSVPVYRNTALAQAVSSIGSGNVSSGGTMFDANPIGNAFIIDRTGIATLRQTLIAFDYRANASGSSNPQLWVSTLPSGSPSYSSNRGFGIDNNGKAIANGSGLRTQINGTDSNILDDGVGRATFAGTVKTRQTTTASRPSASTEGLGAQMYDTTLHKPIWSDGTVWRDAAGTAV